MIRFLKICIGLSIVAMIILWSTTCSDPEEVALYACNHKPIPTKVFVFGRCLKEGELFYSKYGGHTIGVDECVYFVDLAWECDTSWWAFKMNPEIVGCEDFRLIYYISDARVVRESLFDLDSVRAVTIGE